MRVPFEWLKEFIEIKESPNEVAHRLTMSGLEVEAIEQMDSDVVFEINVTPNRPDCLSVIGIARELSAAYKTPLIFPEHDVLAETGELDFNVDIVDTELCHRYAGRVVKNLKVGNSPEWLKRRLELCGIRSINNVVDVTNYVLLELGHPLHAFDLRTIKGHRIIVGTSKKVRTGVPKKSCDFLGYKSCDSKIKMRTLDGIEREIPDDALLIWDAERPIAVAGVMGGMETGVIDSTQDIFIESAYFEPISIRKTSKALGLKTESSYRFERGTDIKMLKKALDRAAYLMKEIAGGTICGKIDIYPKRYKPDEISVRYNKVNEILGLKLTKEEIIGCLDGLGFEMKKMANSLKIKTPAYRRDIKREIDVIEEIARIYGYDRIHAQLPKATIISQESRVKSHELKIKNNIKESFLKLGFTEVVNYSFMGMQEIDLLGISQDDERRSLVQLKNPLKMEESFMRTTLIPSFIKNMIHNLSHGNRELRLFEIARVFIRQESDSLPVEREHLAALYYKEKSKSLYKDDTANFYIVKGVIEAVLNDLKIYNYSFVRSSEPFLHPGQSADIYIDRSQKTEDRGQNSKLKIGYVGALSPTIVDSLDIKAHKPSVIVMEINIESLTPHALQEVKYRPLPKYPYIERDTAIIVDSMLEASSLMKWLKSYPSDLIEDVYIFDVYQGKNIPEGRKSIAFNVRYRASDRTLKDDEIDTLHKSLVDYILDKTKGQLRDN
ncbi:phenylalanine--tRNA ligase subunit beta [hot springs metagenome]|uniref:phenylalanine--tRNA ligase n=1 Tax=hot springs metagenome TaxID=433727 RepID=A0A5J4L900_9ZZZZ